MSAGITSLGGGWLAIRVTVTSLSTVTDFRCALNFIKTATTARGVNEGNFDGTSGIYICGAQLEVGAFPTSYIPTVASQVTRSADVASVNLLSPWYNASEGTLFLSCSAIGVPLNAGTAVSLTDGTTANRILVGQYFNFTRIGGIGVGNVDQCLFSVTPPVTLNAPHSFAMSWAANSFAGSLDGSVPLTDNSGAIPTVTTLHIGALKTVQRFCGHIRTLEYFDYKFTPEDLRSITTPQAA